jgi:eukaryotic-like serine/threonine-protein kinase
MRRARTDRRAAEGGAVRLGWLLALAGIVVITVVVLAVWATPPNWFLAVRRDTVSVLHWAKDNWLSTAALSTAAGVIGVLTPFVLRWLDRRHPAQAPEQAQHSQHPRAVMLRRVRYKWITGVLEPSLGPAVRLVLGLKRRPDLLDQGSIGRPGRPPAQLAADTSIVEVFDKVAGGLLILGAPGAGKTTVLLQLCDQLLDRAEHDLDQPMPVVVNLASWADRRLPLDAWLIEELARGYQVPHRIATDWVQKEALVLLLDGLDEVAEVHRAACAEAINAWRRDHGLVSLVVCCRTRELEMLGVSLQLEEAVEVQPPSDAEVDRYLGYLQSTGTPIGDLRAALANDQDLRRLLHSPLLLQVVALAYHGRPASALSASGSLEQRQRWLWQAYVQRMFERRPLDPGYGYTTEQALDWLAWLARTLWHRGQSEFHLDRLTPEWLPTLSQQRRARVVTWLAVGLPWGLAVGSAFALMNRAIALTFGLVGGVAFGLGAGLVLAPILGLMLGLAGALKDDAKPAQPADWGSSKGRSQVIRRQTVVARDEQGLPSKGTRPQKATTAVAFALAVGLGGGLSGGLWRGLAFGLSVALALGLASGIALALTSRQVDGQPIGVEPTEQVRWSWAALRAGLPRWLSIGLAVAVVMGVLYGLAVDPGSGLVFACLTSLTIALILGPLAGLTAGLRDERVMPNEGIRRSAEHAVLIGLAAGVGAALTGGLGYGLLFRRAGALPAGLGFGLVIGATIAIVFGGTACVQHYVVRAWLVRARSAPWQYGRFLEALTQRLLLRRSGSAYLFVHRLLRDYLADVNPDRAQAAAHSSSDGPRHSVPNSLALPSDPLSDAP